MNNNVRIKPHSTLNVCLISLASAFMCVCSWITVPFTIPFTMQTFAVFLLVFIFNDYRAVVSIVIYILLGAIGLPVFSGFQSGIGWLFGPTGGYIFGFVLCAIIYLSVKSHIRSRIFKLLSMIFGLLSCYLLGTLWFCIYSRDVSPKSFASALAVCVLPFIIPDLLKLILALFLSKRINIVDTNRQK